MNETLSAGGHACLPRFPKLGLSESFIDPALATLAARGATIHLGRRIATLEDLRLAPDEAAILAVPAAVAPTLLPGLQAPDRFESILNVHYRIRVETLPDIHESGFIGLVGGRRRMGLPQTRRAQRHHFRREPRD